MRTTRQTLLSIIAVVALVSAACGSNEETSITGSTTTTAATSTTTTAAETTTDPPATEPTTTTEPVSDTVTIFFSTGDGSDCAEVSPFTRTITRLEDGEPGLEAALLELIAGPTADETAAGAGSFFSSETATTLELIDQFTPGLTIVGFGDLQALIPNASSSCGSEALLAQLNTTLLQFTPRVRYQMLGSCQLFANWLQRECMDYTTEGAEPAELTLPERAGGSGCQPPVYGLTNGQWFGYVDSATESEIEFDIACWFTGDAAIEAATEDGEESPPPNDYHVRNDDDLVVSVPVAPTATVSWLPDIGDPSTETTVAFGEWIELRTSRPVQLGVWLTVRNDQVVEIAEQFVP